MFRPKSSDIVIEQEVVRIPCENGLEFTGDNNNQVRFRVPRNIGLAKLSDAYIEVDVVIGNAADTTQPAMTLDRIAGGNSCINQMTIRSADSGRVIEQLRQYNQYAHLHYNSTTDEGLMNKRSRLEGCAESYLISDSPFLSMNENCKATDDPTNFLGSNTVAAEQLISVDQCFKQQRRKLMLPLLGGVFSTAQSFPLMGIPLDIEILLEKSLRCLQVVENSVNIECVETLQAGATVASGAVIIEQTGLFSGITGASDDTVPIAVNVGETAINPMANLPFRVGQKVQVSFTGTVSGTVSNSVQEIDSIYLLKTVPANSMPAYAVDAAAHKIVIAFLEDEVTPVGGMTGCTISALNAAGQPVSNTPASYMWSAPQLVIPKVVPSPSIVQAMANKIAKGEFSMDLNSFALYSNAINSGQSSSTNIIPADLSRCKSILSVPIEQVNQDRLDNSNALAGQYLNAESYQYSINNILRPDRLVDLTNEQYPANVDVVPAGEIRRPYTLGKYHSALHLHEARKALVASNINTMNLQFITKTMNQSGGYIIGRQLGTFGSSENLVAKSCILYLNYISGESNSLKLLQNFVVHTRTIAMGMDGLSVLF